MKNLINLTILMIVLFSAEMALSTPSLDSIFNKVAKEQNVPVSLLRAICWAESTHSPIAYNHSDGGSGNSSFGLCQVLYTTAKMNNLIDLGCERNFDYYDKVKSNCRLFDPHVNITLAAKILRKLLSRYNEDWVNSIAAYNTGSVKICKSGVVTRKRDKKVLYKCIIGGYLNNQYVSKVIKALDEGR